ncbi:bacteriophage T4 gp5 trimerisation domain-containing protein [Helicobacter ganmani]|uniref:bacteriophage T4 gp5 trimerisation domain-containing protein n=1 Tax=Helicobacter ganmani TaxID=60246 RepID=UPI003A896990
MQPIEQGSNELIFSNLKEQEHIYLQAQRDYEELIKHNFTQTIHNNKESQVEGTYNERIKKIHTQTIDLAKIVSIGGEYNTNVALSKDTIVGLSHTLNVGVDNKVRIAKKCNRFRAYRVVKIKWYLIFQYPSFSRVLFDLIASPLL